MRDPPPLLYETVLAIFSVQMQQQKRTISRVTVLPNFGKFKPGRIKITHEATFPLAVTWKIGLVNQDVQVTRIEMKKIQLLFFLLSMLCDVIIFDYPLLI